MRTLRCYVVAALTAITVVQAVPAQVVLASATRSPQRGQSLLDLPARLDVRGVSLTIALTRLASESGVSVGFSPTKLRSDSRTVACRCADLTIAEALNRLLIGLLATSDHLYAQLSLLSLILSPES